MNSNNFQQLNGLATPPKEVKKYIKSHLNSLKFIGSLMDLYIVKSALVILKIDPTPKVEKSNSNNDSLTK